MSLIPAIRAALAAALTIALSTVARPAPLRVVTLSSVLTEIASRVGGPDATVAGLLPAGVDPHSFEPAPVDLQRVARADVVLASGLGLEKYLDRLVANSGTQARIVDVGSALKDQVPALDAFGRTEPDPHWWNSVPAVERVTRRVCAEFTALRPREAAAFESRTSSYLASLEALDTWARAVLSTVPKGHRQIVTTHDAFGWFAREYGFTVHPISGISPDSDPNARQLAQLARLIERDGIPAIFVESTTNRSLVEALVRETGARLGGELYADGLSPDGDGTTYDGMFRHNVGTLAEALK